MVIPGTNGQHDLHEKKKPTSDFQISSERNVQEKIRLMFGLSFNHLNQPRASFKNEPPQHDRRGCMTKNLQDQGHLVHERSNNNNWSLGDSSKLEARRIIQTMRRKPIFLIVSKRNDWLPHYEDRQFSSSTIIATFDKMNLSFKPLAWSPVLNSNGLLPPRKNLFMFSPLECVFIVFVAQI